MAEFRPAVQFEYPFALKVGTGKINAVTGRKWSHELSGDPQDYVVLPDQPWLDGYCIEKGVIRQFVAAPFDRGITVEEQLTRESTWGGVQLLAFPMKVDRGPELSKKWEEERARLLAAISAGEMLWKESRDYSCAEMSCEDAGVDLGLAAGGRMRQAIYDEPYGIDTWDQEHGSRCFVTILDSEAWTAITGEAMPAKPIDAAAYTMAGLPWFDYQTDQPAIEGSEVLKSLKSIAQVWKNPEKTNAFETPIDEPNVKSHSNRQVREMGSYSPVGN